jgi:flagellar biosynthesis protein
MKNKSINISAVAMSFNPETGSAPEVVARGEGVFAENIIKVAREHGKEIIADSKLLSLLKEIPVGKEIPESLYKTIAVIYSYFYKLNSEKRE